MADPPSSGPGGFIRTLPSPAPSTTSTTSRAPSSLPHPRGRPLLPNSAKEDKVRTYVETQLLYISRRYIKHFAVPNPDDQIAGYRSISELCRDVEGLVNILWLSATPSLQIPYLLNIANEFTEWLTHFPPSPRATFSLLKKLDHCFASLLLGRDIASNEVLPGFEDGAAGVGMSGTDKVRCRSTVEQTRVLVVEVMNNKPEVEELDDDEENEEEEDGRGYNTPTTDTMSDTDNGEDDELDEMDIEVARVYEHTLIELGESIGNAGG